MSRRWDKSKPPSGPFALNRDCPQAVGLVAWYPMGMAGKGYVADAIDRYHLSGTTGTPTLSADGAPALGFSAGGLGVVALPVSAFPLTMAAWCRPSAVANGNILGLCSNTGASGYGRKLLFAHSDGGIKAYSQGDGAGEFKAVASGSYSAGRWMHAATVFASASDSRTYRDGGNKGTSTTFRDWGTSADRVRLGDDNSGGNFFSGDIGESGIWAAALDDGLIWRLYDPGTRFELWYPLRSPRWISLGGSSWTVTLTDLASATDTYTHSVDVQATLSDSASATDTLTQSVVAAATLLDSASATDVLTAAAVVQAAITDLATATDTASATFDASGTANLTDLASATDSLTAAAVVLRSLIDTAAGTDACSAATTMVRTLTDAAAATDSYTASVPGAWTVTLTELAAAVDVIAGAFSGTEIHSAPPLLQRLQASTRAARLSATRAARTQSSTR